VHPDLAAIAFSVVVVVKVKGDAYTVDAVVGVEPSVL
jgi:hypothetical protein